VVDEIESRVEKEESTMPSYDRDMGKQQRVEVTMRCNNLIKSQPWVRVQVCPTNVTT
jgi:hypothetical protein